MKKKIIVLNMLVIAMLGLYTFNNKSNEKTLNDFNKIRILLDYYLKLMLVLVNMKKLIVKLIQQKVMYLTLLFLNVKMAENLLGMIQQKK